MDVNVVFGEDKKKKKKKNHYYQYAVIVALIPSITNKFFFIFFYDIVYRLLKREPYPTISDRSIRKYSFNQYL